jgi:hypothetical protein
MLAIHVFMKSVVEVLLEQLKHFTVLEISSFFQHHVCKLGHGGITISHSYKTTGKIIIQYGNKENKRN